MQLDLSNSTTRQCDHIRQPRRFTQFTTSRAHANSTVLHLQQLLPADGFQSHIPQLSCFTTPSISCRRILANISLRSMSSQSVCHGIEHILQLSCFTSPGLSCRRMPVNISLGPTFSQSMCLGIEHIPQLSCYKASGLS
jgi:hypothetical protein